MCKATEMLYNEADWISLLVLNSFTMTQKATTTFKDLQNLSMEFRGFQLHVSANASNTNMLMKSNHAVSAKLIHPPHRTLSKGLKIFLTKAVNASEWTEGPNAEMYFSLLGSSEVKSGLAWSPGSKPVSLL